MLIFLFPAGVFLCFRELRDEHLFIIIYAVLSSYFAGVMVRLMLVITPVVCVSAAMAFSTLLKTYMDPIVPSIDMDTDRDSVVIDEKGEKKTPRAYAEKVKSSKPGIYGLDTRLAVLTPLVCSLVMFVYHCTWVTSNAYSSPSVVLASRNADGSPAVIDDFRSAYKWLRENTEEDAVIASWWDYGYQIAGFSNRTTLVDNSEYGVRVVPEVGAAELTGMLLRIIDTWNNSERKPTLARFELGTNHHLPRSPYRDGRKDHGYR